MYENKGHSFVILLLEKEKEEHDREKCAIACTNYTIEVLS